MKGDILLYENPYGNPRRKRRKSRNPSAGAMALPKPIRRFLPVSVQEIVAGAGGLLAATMIPAAVYPAPATNMQKLAKIGVALASAIGASMLAGTLAGGARKAALIGGVSGTALVSVGMFTKWQLLGGRKLLGNRPVHHLGESREASSPDEKGVLVSVT